MKVVVSLRREIFDSIKQSLLSLIHYAVPIINVIDVTSGMRVNDSTEFLSVKL